MEDLPRAQLNANGLNPNDPNLRAANNEAGRRGRSYLGNLKSIAAGVANPVVVP
jgi:hypothetical protein